jgi:hypothetical protein
MPRPLRHQSEEAFYMITNRCGNGEFLMRPDPECRRIIAGCLARQVDKKDARLVCFGFYSNHFHAILGFPKLNRGSFMSDFTAQVSGRINDLRGRSGSMFPIRYDDQLLCDDQALRDKICYVLNNPVKDGLVPRADAWPGVNSMACHKTGDPFEGRWLNHERWTKLQARKTTDHERSEAMEHYTVDLYLPDALDGETDAEKRETLLELVEQDRQRLHDEAKQELGCPPKFMGAEKILNQDCRARPADSEIDKCGRSKRRMYVSSEPGGAAARRDKHRERTRDYREAARAMRNDEPYEFPHGMHPPGRARCVGHRRAAELFKAATDS